ncbi:unnamed protein product [Rhizoctonia solani]|uniref:Uncharacterized protein n=3 Tax=Rhizoctonia solani TaxID=456999 RepID=A0A8H2WK82_9AGAM|nr:hypothetical protein RSOL_443200 [Rhizoctonia solani AG-3 Rhs1AP]KEP55763.1 hypothetical protein V565_000160 [Rhizoctonia solani 123E]CAE6388763.1 unnamed protein product [Rhizoctonia solani]
MNSTSNPKSVFYDYPWIPCMGMRNSSGFDRNNDENANQMRKKYLVLIIQLSHRTRPPNYLSQQTMRTQPEIPDEDCISQELAERALNIHTFGVEDRSCVF